LRNQEPVRHADDRCHHSKERAVDACTAMRGAGTPPGGNGHAFFDHSSMT
jgi:hypothetical protein